MVWQPSQLKTISSEPRWKRFATKSETSSRRWKKMLEFTSQSCMWTGKWRRTIFWCNCKLISAGFPFVSLFYQWNVSCLNFLSHWILVRSQTNDTTSLGCAIAAGRAEGIDLVDLSPQNRVYSVKVHHDTYLPTSTDEDRKARVKKWKMAVERSYGWAISSTTQTAMTSKLNHKIKLLFWLRKLWNN